MKKKRRAKLLIGYTLHLQTYDNVGQLAISFISQNHESNKEIRPDLLEIYSILTKVQSVFPNLFITSNKAEHFNSVHDRELSYRGKKTPENANKRLKSWILFKYYRKGIEWFLIKSKINTPYSVLQKTYQLQIKEVNFI
ncbi:MAG: hypothetical protein HeimC3_24170 [Candidatus Heimdallarchaeota archaeon LC_3]|nr:MAG: hypothetical protein HeimC3_24170 [Candidatus Heimdallarchaeota archaeon LC_3]